MAHSSNFRGEKVFTFQIGPTKEEIQMHPSVVKAISQPLYALMTNGHLEESISRVAKLPEADPETFHLFTQWAYSRTYQTAPGKSTPEPAPKLNRKLELKGVSSWHCCWCYDGCPVDSSAVYPFCDSNCAEGALDTTNFDKNLFCARCGDRWLNFNGAWHENLSRLCQRCRDGRTALLASTTCATIFRERQFGPTADTLASLLKLHSLSTSKGALMIPLSHAKLYVFADMYLIEELKHISLRRLHQDLTRMAVTKVNKKYVNQVLLYAYENTPNTDIEDGVWCNDIHELRGLVLAYVLDNSQIMATGEDTITTIDSNKDLLTDVLTGLAAKKELVLEKVE